MERNEGNNMERIHSLLNDINDTIKNSTKAYNEDVQIDDNRRDYDDEIDVIDLQTEMFANKMQLDALKKALKKMRKSKGQDFTDIEDMEEETIEQEMMEYKNDFYEIFLF